MERKRPRPLRVNCWNSTSLKQTEELLTLRCQLYLNQRGQNESYVVPLRHSSTVTHGHCSVWKWLVSKEWHQFVAHVSFSAAAVINNFGRVKKQARYNLAHRVMESLWIIFGLGLECIMKEKETSSAALGSRDESEERIWEVFCVKSKHKTTKVWLVFFSWDLLLRQKLWCNEGKKNPYNFTTRKFSKRRSDVEQSSNGFAVPAQLPSRSSPKVQHEHSLEIRTSEHF